MKLFASRELQHMRRTGTDFKGEFLGVPAAEINDLVGGPGTPIHIRLPEGPYGDDTRCGYIDYIETRNGIPHLGIRFEPINVSGAIAENVSIVATVSAAEIPLSEVWDQIQERLAEYQDA